MADHARKLARAIDGSMALNRREQLAYSIQDVTKLTGLGRSYIYEEIRIGRLRIRKAGRRSLVIADDLKARLASLPAKPS
jgi:excisionase family DNA binding protein